MDIVDSRTFWRRRNVASSWLEVLSVTVVFSCMGAIAWAIRGTHGWSGIDGTIIPGMIWGMFWWYCCWRKGVDARSVPLWLGLGIALGGELGYGQYVAWIRGIFQVGDEVIPIAPWFGYAWFAICGIGWGATGGIALGWALAGRQSLGIWLVRLTIPVGVALLTRCVIQAFPWSILPNYELGVYVPQLQGGIDPTIVAATQTWMLIAWAVSVGAAVVAWLANRRGQPASWVARGACLGAVAISVVLLLLVADWLFFPSDQLGLYRGELGGHLARTLYTNAQNAIVVGWWAGALLVAAFQRDRATIFAGAVLGVGFGIGFPLSALWCLGYEVAPGLVDWWKMWELQAGMHLGLLYVVVLYWALRNICAEPASDRNDDSSVYRQWCATMSLAGGAFLIIYVMSREEFLVVGVLVGLLFVAAMVDVARRRSNVSGRRRGVEFVFSAWLLVFIMAWGATSQIGILLGLYDAAAADQYAWPAARAAMFAPIGALILGVGLIQLHRAIRDPDFLLPSTAPAPRVAARLVDLMTFTGLVGAATIWPAKISVLYAMLLAISLFAHNRLNLRLDASDAQATSRASQPIQS